MFGPDVTVASPIGLAPFVVANSGVTEVGINPRRTGSAAAAQGRGIAPVGHFPVDVAEEGVDVFGGGGSVIHVETVLVHIEREQRHAGNRSEEHTSELQSLMRTSYAVFCLKKKKKHKTKTH